MKINDLKERLNVAKSEYRKLCNEFMRLNSMLDSVEYKTRMNKLMEFWHQIFDMETELKEKENEHV